MGATNLESKTAEQEIRIYGIEYLPLEEQTICRLLLSNCHTSIE